MSAITYSLNLCCIPHPLLKKNAREFPVSIVLMPIGLNQCSNACDDEKEIQIWPTLLNIKMLDQKWIFWVSSPTLLADVLWRQSMLQINGCGRKSNAHS